MEGGHRWPQALDHSHLHPQAGLGRRGRARAGPGIRNVLPKMVSGGGRREQSPLRRSGLEASGGNCKVQGSRRAQGLKGRPSMGKPFPVPRLAPSPGGGPGEREAPEGARRSTKCAGVICRWQTPSRPSSSQPRVGLDPTPPGRPPSRPVTLTRPWGTAGNGPGRQGWGRPGPQLSPPWSPTRDLLVEVLLL